MDNDDKLVEAMLKANMSNKLNKLCEEKQNSGSCEKVNPLYLVKTDCEAEQFTARKVVNGNVNHNYTLTVGQFTVNHFNSKSTISRLPFNPAKRASFQHLYVKESYDSAVHAQVAEVFAMLDKSSYRHYCNQVVAQGDAILHDFNTLQRAIAAREQLEYELAQLEQDLVDAIESNARMLSQRYGQCDTEHHFALFSTEYAAILPTLVGWIVNSLVQLLDADFIDVTLEHQHTLQLITLSHNGNQCVPGISCNVANKLACAITLVERLGGTIKQGRKHDANLIVISLPQEINITE